MKAIEFLWFFSIIPVIYFTIECKIVWFILMWVFFPFIYLEVEYELEK